MGKDKQEEVKKKIDESWKEAVEKEKKEAEKGGGAEAAKAAFPEANFSLFVSGLAMQGLMYIGELENPVTKKKEKDLNQARYVIDTLTMLKEKTKNNLSKEEDEMLDNLLYDLRMRYVAASEKSTGAADTGNL